MNRIKILVWDAPTRVFHWLLAASFAGAFLTAESERLRTLHVNFGYTFAALLAFRLLWGVIGTRYARFGSFAFGARAVLSYIKSVITFSPQHYTGHNPVGSWAIYAIFALGVLTAISGYAAYNEIGGDWLAELHESAANGFLAVVIAHVVGVVVSSLIHRENLALAMLTGYKRGPANGAIRYRHRLVAIALVLALGALWIAGPDAVPSIPAAEVVTSAGHHVGHETPD